jgi:DNA polymerase III gamma/tau subunit
LSFTGDAGLLYGYSPGALERIKEMASRQSRQEWMFLLDMAFRSERDVLGTEFPNLGFELLILRLSNARELLTVEELETALADSPMPRPHSLPESNPAVSPSPAFSRKTAPARPEPGVESAAKKESPRSGDIWGNVKRIVEGKRKAVLSGLLTHMEGELREDRFVVFCSEVFIERIKEPDKWNIVLSAIEEAVGRPVSVSLEVSAEKKSRETEVSHESWESLEQRASSDPVVIETLRVFDATLARVIPLSADAKAKAAKEASAAAEGEGDGEEVPVAEAMFEEEEE